MARALRLVRLVGLAALASMGLACGGATPGAASDSTQDEVTSTPETAVKEQSVGNCWIYATLGWVESMHLAHAGEQLNLSESYLTYLHWFLRITTDRFVFDKHGDWNTGDFVGWGEELIARYGLMDEGAFISTEANIDRSARQEAAEVEVKRALAAGGALASATKRRDPAAVREVLNKAFKLTPAVASQLTAAFGADLARTRGRGATPSPTGFRDPARLIVGTTKAGVALTLDDALGELDPNRVVSATRDRGERRGTYAWTRVAFGKNATERAAVMLRVKRTLNAGFPVPIDWFPAWASMRESDASFHEPVNLSRKGGWHASLVHDYQIKLASGQVLAAGTPVTDPALLAKTLEPGATLEFLRFKNSWGRDVGPFAARGYTDATWAYLSTDFDRTAIDYDEPAERGAAIDAFILPPESWDGVRH